MATLMYDIALRGVIGGGEDLTVTAAGDFNIVESTGQHQTELIIMAPGEIKEDPTICVGAFNYLHDENPQDLIRAIALQFTTDGMDVKSVLMGTDGVIATDAFYP